MRLKNIESKQLLPRFASKIAWVMNALDSLIKTTVQRVKSIDAPLTMEAIEACTDEELEALYEQYGVAQYYPDLSRQTRNKMLYEMCRIYRYLGTPKAIETLCNYIFDGVQLNVKVFDNLAFDEDGTLVDESLLDVFDIEVNPTEPIFGADVNARILANIIRFSRNSQALRNIIYSFIQDFSISVSPCKRTGNPQVTQTWPQDSLCVPYTPPAPSYTEITLYVSNTSKYVQNGITNSFTGNVNSSYTYTIFTDAQHNNKWSYDYSNDYEVGDYIDGVWTRYIDSVSGMPDQTSSSGFSVGLVLLDVGRLWIISSGTQSGGYTSLSQFVVRVYPKGQQYFAAYMNYSSTYGNYTLVNTYSREGVSSPGGSSNKYIQTPHQFPKITLQKVLGSAGNELTRSQFTTFQGADSTRFRLYNYGPSTADVRVAVYTLEYPIIGYWLKSDGTNISTSSGVAYPLMNIGGEIIEIDNDFDYFPIGLIQHNGNYATDTYSYLNNATMGAFDPDHPTRLCFKQVSGTLSLSYVQYYKKPKQTT